MQHFFHSIFYFLLYISYHYYLYALAFPEIRFSSSSTLSQPEISRLSAKNGKHLTRYHYTVFLWEKNRIFSLCTWPAEVGEHGKRRDFGKLEKSISFWKSFYTSFRHNVIYKVQENSGDRIVKNACSCRSYHIKNIGSAKLCRCTLMGDGVILVITGLPSIVSNVPT